VVIFCEAEEHGIEAVHGGDVGQVHTGGLHTRSLSSTTCEGENTAGVGGNLTSDRGPGEPAGPATVKRTGPACLEDQLISYSSTRAGLPGQRCPARTAMWVRLARRGGMGEGHTFLQICMTPPHYHVILGT
jgi:hypothetical protein